MQPDGNNRLEAPRGVAFGTARLKTIEDWQREHSCGFSEAVRLIVAAAEAERAARAVAE